MKVLSRALGVCSVILLLFLALTDPREIPSVLLVVPFILLFAILFFLMIYIARVYKTEKIKKFHIYILAASPVLLLVMQSLGQLTSRDVLVVALLLLVAYFYVSRFGMHPTQ